jgi:hypothetical protein
MKIDDFLKAYSILTQAYNHTLFDHLLQAKKHNRRPSVGQEQKRLTKSLRKMTCKPLFYRE